MVFSKTKNNLITLLLHNILHKIKNYTYPNIILQYFYWHYLIIVHWRFITICI